MKKLFFINKTIAVITAVLVFAACSSEDEVEFIDNSDALNKEFGVTNQIDEKWLESLKISYMPYAYMLVESVEYSKQGGTWAINTGVCPNSHENPGSAPCHWAPKTIAFKDGNIYVLAGTPDKAPNNLSIIDLCLVAYKNDTGVDLNFYYVSPIEIDDSIPAIKGLSGYTMLYNIVELNDKTLIVKESYTNCFSLTKYQFAPYFEFADGVYGSEVRFVSETLQGCWTKFFEVFKKHFGDKVNLSKLAFNDNDIVFNDKLTKDDISMAELEEYLRKYTYIE